ncbi:MAG: C40 family peptidase, partial [Chitinophagaceae bacterium]|nr:C40 family peptidase [Chitinophagaceae bacterium]
MITNVAGLSSPPLMLCRTFYIVLVGSTLVGCNVFKRTVTPIVAHPVSEKTTVVSPSVVSRPTHQSPKEIPPENNSPRVQEITTAPWNSPETLYQLQFKYAILLDAPVEEMLNHRLLTFLESWYGTRYRYGGIDSTGIDCSAFVQSFLVTLYGVMLPRTSQEQFTQCR